MANNFTSDEQIGITRGTFALLIRYVWDLRLFRLVTIPAIICAFVSSGSYQLFTWISGLYADCNGDLNCSTYISTLNINIPVTLITMSVIAVTGIIIRILGWVLFEVVGQWSALTLHGRMVSGIGHVRTTFFDEYPSGKLINRLVRDFDQLRTMGPIRIGDTFNALAEILILSGVIFLAQPLAALAVVPTLIAFFYIQRNVAPMMQRCLSLRSVRLGEVLHRETDVIEGIRSFTLYGHEKALFERLQNSLSKFVQVHVLRNQMEAWGRFWGQVASANYGFITLLCVAYGIHTKALSPILGAVVVTAVFRLGGMFGWLTWASGLLIESAAHARRVYEYVDLPSEESEELKEVRHETVKPFGELEGDLIFSNYTMSYRPNTPVILSKLSLTVKQGSKVGIIGRTGAGKTSLLQALFRMVYVQEGDILIGHQSLLSLPIDSARGLFGVVPQDPYLFEGTIRSNLDRYNTFQDNVLTQALEIVNLPLALNTTMHEGGKNLSVGERQLICLARVLINHRPIVIMDEPTSGVDSITDAIIQRILRTALADRTVITIAHRLETLSRMERIIELKDGNVVRDGVPQEIIPQISLDDI